MHELLARKSKLAPQRVGADHAWFRGFEKDAIGREPNRTRSYRPNCATLMAYLLYQKIAGQDADEYVQLRSSALAGNRMGLIARHLQGIVAPDTAEPWRWHLPMAATLKQLEPDVDAFVIDLKPDDRTVVSMYEVRNIWGFTDSGWTPILLNLETLLVDDDARVFDKRRFEVARAGRERVATFLYLQGGVRGGQLTGTWNFPRPSSTNSVLLWPEPLAYFLEQLGYCPTSAVGSAAPGGQPEIRVVNDPIGMKE